MNGRPRPNAIGARASSLHAESRPSWGLPSTAGAEARHSITGDTPVTLSLGLVRPRRMQTAMRNTSHQLSPSLVFWTKHMAAIE